MKRDTFCDLLRFELKKLFVNRITILMLVLSAGFLCGITMFEYIVVSPEDQHVAGNEVEIEGLPLDENLIGAVVAEAENAGGLVNIPGDSRYHHIAQYMNRAMGAYMSIDGITGDYALEDLSEEKFYQTRMDVLAYLYDFFQLTQDEKQFWAGKESAIKKPFVWKANYGISSMRANYGTLAALASMLIGVCLAGVFAAERRYKTEDLIVCTKEGRTRLLTAKLLAGEVFSLAVAILLFLAVQCPHIVYNGFDGIGSICQTIVPFSSLPYSSGRLLAVLTGIYLVAALFVGAITELISCATKSMIATAGMICFSVVGDLFFAIPARMRFFSQIRCLTPVQVLSNASMTDPRLVQVGGHFLTSFQAATIIYVVLTCVFCMVIYRASSRMARRKL